MKITFFIFLFMMSFICKADVFCLKASDFSRSISISDNGYLQTAVDGVSGRIYGHGLKVDWFKDSILGQGVHLKVLNNIPEEINLRKLDMSKVEVNKLFTLDVQFGLGAYYHGKFLCIENYQLFVSYGRKLGEYNIIIR